VRRSDILLVGKIASRGRENFKRRREIICDQILPFYTHLCYILSMDEEIKGLLKENLSLSKENNQLLKKVRNFQRWSQITRFLYWFVIIGIAVGAFYFIQPYLGGVLNLYTGGVSDINSVKDINKTLSVENWRDLIKDVNQ